MSRPQRVARVRSLQEACGLPYRGSENAERCLRVLLHLHDNDLLDQLGAAEFRFVDGTASWMRERPPSREQTRVLEQIGARYGFREPQHEKIRRAAA